MSDDTTMMQPPQPQLPVEGSGQKKPGLLSSAGGKMVAIILGLCVVGIIIGIAVAFALATVGQRAAEELVTSLQESQSTTQSAGATSTAEVEKTPAEEIANKDVFTFRDVFEPVLKRSSVTPPSSSTTSTPDTITPTANNTLYLDGVITENGILKAQLRYNGQSYSLAAGGTIPNSPWEVLRVSSTSVIMLYGDVQVTISVGQGITK